MFGVVILNLAFVLTLSFCFAVFLHRRNAKRVPEQSMTKDFQLLMTRLLTWNRKRPQHQSRPIWKRFKHSSCSPMEGTLHWTKPWKCGCDHGFKISLVRLGVRFSSDLFEIWCCDWFCGWFWFWYWLYVATGIRFAKATANQPTVQRSNSEYIDIVNSDDDEPVYGFDDVDDEDEMEGVQESQRFWWNATLIVFPRLYQYHELTVNQIDLTM